VPHLRQRAQIPKALCFCSPIEKEEASYASGGSWLRTFCRITLPLLLPAFVNGWIFSAIVVAKAMGSVIMIYSHDSMVLSVLVWELWSNGDVSATAALGVMLISGLLVATCVARKFTVPNSIICPARRASAVSLDS
jgi:ABC-type Fe3+ transport system permease subunit